MLGRSEIFGLAIASGDLIGISLPGGFSSNMFPDVFITVVCLPILGLFIFTRRVSITLAFRLNIEVTDPFLGVPLSIFFVLPFSVGGSEVFGGFYLTVNVRVSC